MEHQVLQFPAVKKPQLWICDCKSVSFRIYEDEVRCVLCEKTQGVLVSRR